MNIIDLTKEAGIVQFGDGFIDITKDELDKFAALVAAQEREACCAIVYGLCESDNVAQRTVDAIRARGTT